VLCGPDLGGLHEQCLSSRAAVVADARRVLDARSPLILAAAWVESGKTPRQHQDRYARFLDIAEQECSSRKISATFGIRSLANENIVPFWLNEVSSGRSPQNATRQFADQQAERAKSWGRDEPESFISSLREAWIASGIAWQYTLEGIAMAHEGDVIALFHEHGLGLGWDLGRAFYGLLPRAVIRTDEFSWVVARVPAVLSLFLKERDRSLKGLVLDRGCAHLFADPAKCGLFLRNLLVSLECHDLVSHVREIRSGDTESAGKFDVPATQLHWQRRGFGTGVSDAGLTRQDCLPALRAAIDDQQLKLRPARTSVRTRKS
jgi:hypothetical protein